jgi:hypothetical protein
MLDRRLLLVAFPFVAFACFSSDDNSAPMDGGSVSPEAGVDSSIADAAPPFADGAPHDASPTDAPVDAPPLPVVVTVIGPNGPESGVTIVFDDSTGALIGMATTSAAGMVSQVLPAGSEVTAAFGTPLAPQLVTIIGVEPGDSLTAYDAPTASIGLSIPALPSPAPEGAEIYITNPGACSNEIEEVPVSVTLNPGCYGATTLPLLIMAQSETEMELGYSYEKAVPFDSDAGTATASNLSAWSTSEGVETVTAMNIADGGATPTAYLSEVVGAVGTNSNGNTDTTATPGASSTTFTSHPGYADFIQTEIDQQQIAQGLGSIQAIATRAAPPAGSATSTFDVTQFLPAITGATIDSTNSARPIINLTVSASLASTDGTFGALGWYEMDDAGDYISASWLILAPPGVTSMQAPTLPTSLSAWAPSTSSMFGVPAVAAVDGTIIPSYAALRQIGLAIAPQGFSQGGVYFNGPTIPPLPVAGTVRLTSYLQMPE